MQMRPWATAAAATAPVLLVVLYVTHRLLRRRLERSEEVSSSLTPANETKVTSLAQSPARFKKVSSPVGTTPPGESVTSQRPLDSNGPGKLQEDFDRLANLGKIRLGGVAEEESAQEALGDSHMVEDAENFELTEILGRGRFVQVELRRVPCSDGASEDSFVVLKRVPLSSFSALSINALVQETADCAAIRHRFIVALHGAYISAKSELCMVLQYVAGVTLWETIQFQRDRQMQSSFPEEFVTAWLGQLCEAVLYLHERRVVHRDISTANIFLSSHGDIVLGNIELFKRLTSEMSGWTRVGLQVSTPACISPEIVNGQENGTSSDVWAVGVVLFEMLALGALPSTPRTAAVIGARPACQHRLPVPSAHPICQPLC